MPSGGKRHDGRAAHDQLMPSCKVGVTEKAQGSCYVETAQGAKVICSVFGPREMGMGGEFDNSCCVKVNFSVASFAEDVRLTKRMQRDLGPEDRHTAACLKETFDCSILLNKYPKAQIDINILLVERAAHSSCNFNAAVMAGTLALVNAGIEVADMAMSSTACLTGEGELLLCPTVKEARDAAACVTITCLPAVGSVLSVMQTGRTTQGQTKEAIELNCKACVALRTEAANVIKEDLERSGV